MTNADEIMVLNNGTITAQGTYHELINTSHLSELLQSIEKQENSKTELAKKKEIEKVEKLFRQLSVISDAVVEADNISNLAFSRLKVWFA